MHQEHVLAGHAGDLLLVKEEDRLLCKEKLVQREACAKRTCPPFRRRRLSCRCTGQTPTAEEAPENSHDTANDTARDELAEPEEEEEEEDGNGGS